nr:MAG TPA: KTSC domain [Caudoviricetes sp.]
MIKVVSSNVHSIGYEPDTLYVKFNNGALYEYYKVPEGIFKAFLISSSKGKFVHNVLRNFYCKRIY